MLQLNTCIAGMVLYAKTEQMKMVGMTSEGRTHNDRMQAEFRVGLHRGAESALK
jgi:hypothetical protein